MKYFLALSDFIVNIIILTFIFYLKFVDDIHKNILKRAVGDSHVHNIELLLDLLHNLEDLRHFIGEGDFINKIPIKFFSKNWTYELLPHEPIQCSDIFISFSLLLLFLQFYKTINRLS